MQNTPKRKRCIYRIKTSYGHTFIAMIEDINASVIMFITSNGLPTIYKKSEIVSAELLN